MNRILYRIVLLVIFGVLNISPTYAYSKPLAYIYSGIGVCHGCDTTLAKAFRKAGFRTEKIFPGEIALDHLNEADVFAIPGGDQELDVMNALQPGEAAAIKKYVEQGGHYFGVCLGGFIAGSKIINTPTPVPVLPDGLDLFKGKVHNHSKTIEARIETILWTDPNQQSISRFMYFQDGPHFTLKDPKAVIWARYSDGSIAAFQTPLGLGRVGLIGIHPEADQSWWNEDPNHPLEDPDGEDIDLFINFVQDLIN